jgi:hypothetical protein
VIGTIEIFGAQYVCDIVPSGRIEEQAAQNGLLRLD